MGLLLPVEVKSGTNAHLRSMQSYMSQEGAPGIGIRIWSGAFSIDEVNNPLSNQPYRLVNLPFYLTGALDKILAKFI